MDDYELYGFKPCGACGRMCDGDACSDACLRELEREAMWKDAHPCRIARDLPTVPSDEYWTEQHPCRCALGEDDCQGCASCLERMAEEEAERTEAAAQ
jgi:hypothetical protein